MERNPNDIRTITVTCNEDGRKYMEHKYGLNRHPPAQLRGIDRP